MLGSVDQCHSDIRKKVRDVESLETRPELEVPLASALLGDMDLLWLAGTE